MLKVNSKKEAAYCLQRKYDLAINDYTTSIELYPKSADPFGVQGLDCHYGGRGFAYYCMDEHDLAIADFTEAIRLNPHAGKAYHYRGVVYREKNEHAKAEADFAKAKELGYEPE
jgi:tetratricopeptide (TPR) repeat protein